MLEVLASVAGLTAAVAAGYQTMAPTGQWYGRTFTGLIGGTNRLALTYDDGPNDPHTLRLLEILAKHNVAATFFMIGRFVTQRPDIVREVVRAGHAVGNHTFSHPNLIFVSSERARKEVSDCQQALLETTGETPQLFRPPFGGRRPGTLQVARALGLEPVMWNVTGYDWSAPPADRIVAKVSRQIRGGDVILLHDGSHVRMGADRSQTVIATDQIIAEYKARGYGFMTIPEMMGKAVRSVQVSAMR
jgi:peptidoglycan/xylan/chitin deacetylase (PgdA/CDA1 family)